MLQHLRNRHVPFGWLLMISLSLFLTCGEFDDWPLSEEINKTKHAYAYTSLWVNLMWTPWSYKTTLMTGRPSMVIDSIALYSGLIDYFTITCMFSTSVYCNALNLKSSLMYGTVLKLGVVLWRTFFLAFFALSLRYHKTYRDSIVSVASSANLLW